MISENQIDDVQRATAYDRSGDKIGKVGQVYLDDATGSPSWITVNTGLFGTSESFVPLEGASFNGNDRVDVAYSKSQVKDAPRVAADGHLEVSEEEELYRYYGLSNAGTSGYDTTTTGTTTGTAPRPAPPATRAPRPAPRPRAPRATRAPAWPVASTATATWRPSATTPPVRRPTRP